MTTPTPEDRALLRYDAERWPDDAWGANTVLALLDTLAAAEAARDTAERQVKAVEDVLAVGVPGYHASGVPLGLVCKVSDIRRALDGKAGR